MDDLKACKLTSYLVSPYMYKVWYHWYEVGHCGEPLSRLSRPWYAWSCWLFGACVLEASYSQQNTAATVAVSANGKTWTRSTAALFSTFMVTYNIQSRLYYSSSEEFKAISFKSQRNILTLKLYRWSVWRRENGTCSFSLAFWKIQVWGEKNPRLHKDSARRNMNQQLRHQQARDRYNVLLMAVNF